MSDSVYLSVEKDDGAAFPVRKLNRRDSSTGTFAGAFAGAFSGTFAGAFSGALSGASGSL